MSSEPPRRRRSQPPSSRSSSGPSLLPTIALGVGVVVAGLGIGAFLSAVQNRGTASSTTSTTAQNRMPIVTPVARPTRGPIAVATMFSHPTDTPSPRPTATPHVTPTPKPTATPRETVSPHATASPKPIATPIATASPKPETTPSPTPRPTATPRTETPRPAATLRAATPRPVTPRPTVVPTAAPTTIVRVSGPPTFAVQAQATVRRYIDALIAGNENGAYAALGASPGDANARLSEEAFVDRGTRITSMRTTSVNAAGATVEVEMTSSRGTYYGTYHVTNGSSGPVIDQHDYIKV